MNVLSLHNGINNIHESPQGTVKLHEILHILKPIYRAQCEVSYRSCEWIWDPHWGVLSSLGTVHQWLMMLIQKYALTTIIIRQFIKNSNRVGKLLGWNLNILDFIYPQPHVCRPQLTGKCSWEWRAGFNFVVVFFFEAYGMPLRKVKGMLQGLLSCGLLSPAVTCLPCRWYACRISQNGTPRALFWNITHWWQGTVLTTGSLGFC